MSSEEMIERFCKFVTERQEIFLKKELGLAKPWTKDPILQHYKFCNVFRAQDPGTSWIADNWLRPNAADKDVWFAAAVARWINWTGTLEEIKYPVPWKPESALKVLRNRKARGKKVWTGAYMIGTQGNAMDKSLFIVEKVLTSLWVSRKELRPRAGDTLASFAARLVAVPNQGRFMVGQIVCDVKYVDPHLLNATDWGSWCISGPGSRRGINRILGRDLKSPWKEPRFIEEVHTLKVHLRNHRPPMFGHIHAQDVQNCLCEFDKYERVRLGQGFPRSKYPGEK